MLFPCPGSFFSQPRSFLYERLDQTSLRHVDLFLQMQGAIAISRRLLLSFLALLSANGRDSQLYGEVGVRLLAGNSFSPFLFKAFPPPPSSISFSRSSPALNLSSVSKDALLDRPGLFVLAQNLPPPRFVPRGRFTAPAPPGP